MPARPFVVDVGANIGMFVIFIKRRYPDAEVISFEPMPERAALLRRNVELHELAGGTVHELALGSRAEGNVSFAFYPMTQMAATVAQKTVDQLYKAREVNAAVDRLAAYLPDDRPVDLLKIDVEGAETDVLLGIDAHQRPLIRRVILEVADLGGELATSPASSGTTASPPPSSRRRSPRPRTSPTSSTPPADSPDRRTERPTQ